MLYWVKFHVHTGGTSSVRRHGPRTTGSHAHVHTAHMDTRLTCRVSYNTGSGQDAHCSSLRRHQFPSASWSDVQRVRLSRRSCMMSVESLWLSSDTLSNSAIASSNAVRAILQASSGLPR